MGGEKLECTHEGTVVGDDNSELEKKSSKSAESYWSLIF